MKSITKRLFRLLVMLWVSPNSLIGLSFGVLALLSGGGMQICRGCLEFHGGFVSWGLSRLMGGVGVAAMTLGHTILGQNPSMLSSARDHEHVHVKQYERWGPFFLIAYLSVSAVLWFRGRDCYRDNFFEIEAYAAHPFQPEDQQGADPDSESTN